MSLSLANSVEIIIDLTKMKNFFCEPKKFASPTSNQIFDCSMSKPIKDDDCTENVLSKS